MAHIAYLDYYWWPSIVSLDFFYRYLFNDTNDVIIRVSICIQYLFIFFFLLLSLSSIHKLLRERGERKKTKKEKTLKTHQSTDADTTSTIKKHLDKTNPTTSRKVIICDWSESRELPKTQVSFTIFGWLIWLALFNVGNLNWYHWICLIEIFLTILVVSLLEFRCVSKIFFLFLFLSFLFIENYVKLFYKLRELLVTLNNMTF